MLKYNGQLLVLNHTDNDAGTLKPTIHYLTVMSYRNDIYNRYAVIVYVHTYPTINSPHD